MDAVEFARWQAVFRFEPWGDEQRMAAMICAAVRNSQRVKGRPFEISDWIVSEHDAKEMSDEQLEASFRMFFANMGNK